MQIYDKAVDMLRKGHSPFAVAKELDAGHWETVEKAQQDLAEESQKAANTAVTMLRDGAQQSDVIERLRGLGLSAFDANEMTLHAMAAVRQEKSQRKAPQTPSNPRHEATLASLKAQGKTDEQAKDYMRNTPEALW